jgi:prepilin-type N-terminal cleavage/methylation domain-containing protein
MARRILLQARQPGNGRLSSDGKIKRPRWGFTLVELLVVIAIIGILLGLLISAIQMFRANAQRLQCANNLRQIAIGVHSFHDQQGRLPYNTFVGAWHDGGNAPNWSWLARLLPYIEQQQIFQDGGISTKTLWASGVADRNIELFMCPCDPGLGSGPRTDVGNLRGMPVGLTSYKGVMGANWGNDNGVGKDFRTDWRNPGTNGSFDGHDKGDGIFYRMDYKRVLRLEGITDGASNTFMIGEDLCLATKWTAWPYANSATGTCAIPPNVKRIDGSDYAPGDWRNNESFRSAHPGGLHFAYADASVHFINSSIDLPVYRAMATIAGREGVTIPD